MLLGSLSFPSVCLRGLQGLNATKRRCLGGVLRSGTIDNTRRCKGDI